MISFSRLPHFLIVCPKYDSFLFSTFSNKLILTSAIFNTHSFVFFSPTVHDTRNIACCMSYYVGVYCGPKIVALLPRLVIYCGAMLDHKSGLVSRYVIAPNLVLLG